MNRFSKRTQREENRGSKKGYRFLDKFMLKYG
jgi:hypothetical protein